MSDERTQNPNEPAKGVSISLDLPSGLVESYDALVASGIYPDRESALPHGLVESWRHNNGSFHVVRLDLDRRKDKREDETAVAPDAPADDATPVG